MGERSCPVPDDPDQVVYVWWDALANYVTALGLRGAAFDRWWAGPGSRVHVIGKGILRFHAVHWLALLLAADLPPPTDLFVHPYLTVDGAKISKSVGTAVDPGGLVDRFGVDAVRWWLVREVGRVLAAQVTPFVPAGAARLTAQLGTGPLVGPAVPSLPRLRAGTARS